MLFGFQNVPKGCLNNLGKITVAVLYHLLYHFIPSSLEKCLKDKEIEQAEHYSCKHTWYKVSLDIHMCHNFMPSFLIHVVWRSS